LGGRSNVTARPQRLDYLNEALLLERSGLIMTRPITSLRLALVRGHARTTCACCQNMAHRVLDASSDYRQRPYSRGRLEIDHRSRGRTTCLAFLLI